MIEVLLPDCVSVAENRAQDVDESRVEDVAVQLFPEEQQAIARAVEKRRREYASGRACARRALGRLGVAPQPILSGGRGEPLWPAGIVGAITHCDGYRACAVARSEQVLAVGIDAEPHLALPEGLLADIARPEEWPPVSELAACRPDVHWDRLLFSAKESVYKAWFPLARRWLGFQDAIVSLDPDAHSFRARLLVAGPTVGGATISGFAGRWLVADGLILTAIALTSSQPL